MVRVSRNRKLTRTTMGISSRRTTFTSSILRLTTGNRKQQMRQTAILSIQKATSSELNQHGDRELRVRNSKSSINQAKRIATRNNLLKITDMRVNIALMLLRTNIASNPRNSRKSSIIEISETIQTSTRLKIIGLTSKRIDTRFRQMLSGELNGLLSLASTTLEKVQPFTPRTEATHKKT